MGAGAAAGARGRGAPARNTGLGDDDKYAKMECDDGSATAGRWPVDFAVSEGAALSMGLPFR